MQVLFELNEGIHLFLPKIVTDSITLCMSRCITPLTHSIPIHLVVGKLMESIQKIPLHIHVVIVIFIGSPYCMILMQWPEKL